MLDFSKIIQNIGQYVGSYNTTETPVNGPESIGVNNVVQVSSSGLNNGTIQINSLDVNGSNYIGLVFNQKIKWFNWDIFGKKKSINQVHSGGTLGKISEYDYLAFTFNEIEYPDKINNVLIGSNDGVHWDVLKNYPDMKYRDPSILKVDNYFYILYTGGLMRTTDWDNFEPLGTPLEVANQWVWAPEFVHLADGSFKIIYAQTSTSQDENSFQLKMADFDSKTGTVTNTGQTVNVNYVVGSPIDPNVTYLNGSYYLWVRENDRKLYLYKSDSMTGTFVNVPTNVPTVQSAWKSEAPEMLIMGDSVMLYSDPWQETTGAEPRQIRYVIADINDLTKWTNMHQLQGLSFGARHFGIF